jgi:hypothetical protein
LKNNKVEQKSKDALKVQREKMNLSLNSIRMKCKIFVMNIIKSKPMEKKRIWQQKYIKINVRVVGHVQMFALLMQ